jgi:hypothetical protein
MSLEKIENTIEKLAKNNQKTFLQIHQELAISSDDLEYWVEIFEELKPKINQENQQYFSNRQFNTIKKIKKFIDDQDGEIFDLAKIFNQNIAEKKSPNHQTHKQHYFEKDNDNKNSIAESLVKNSGDDDDSLCQSDSQLIDQESNIISNKIILDQEENQENKIEFSVDFYDNQNPNQNSLPQELSGSRQIDLTAKLQDFSNIKLYNIHPKINQQIQHRLNCAKLNLEELTNLLKNL